MSEGLFISGHWGLLGYQLLAILASYSLAIVGSLVCLAITSAVTGGLRATEDDEFAGLDLSQHGESAYAFGAGGYGPIGQSAFAARPVERHGTLAAKVAE